MIKSKFLYLLFLILIYYPSFSQRGKDGAKTVTAAGTLVNEYTTLTANAAAGATSITVAASGLNANGRFTGNLAAGDLILIIQIQGATIEVPASSISPMYGHVTNYNNCGLYEFAEVLSVPNSNTINIECALANNYTAAGKTEIVRVPRYSSLTINSPGVLTGDTWDGSKAGICAVEVLGATIINAGGTIDMTGKGFRGGVLSSNSGYGVNNFYWTTSDYGAEKGESIVGFETDYDAIGGRYCRGAPANGGGGGNSHNHGGGGGANAGDTSLWTGTGNPDNTGVGYTTAWNLETPGFSATTSSGGGRGGYSFSSANQNALVLGPYNPPVNLSTAWNGDYRRICAGVGGRPLDYTTGRIFIGGGGGCGDQDNGWGSAGAIGGGIVFIQSYSTVSGSGQILSNGGTAASSTSGSGLFGSSGADGAGGAGGGGTIIIKCTGNASGITATANGGVGGNQAIVALYNSQQSEAEGPGGGGGGGYIALSNGAITATTAGGANGTTNSSGLTEFPPNGATKGGAGINNATIPAFYIVAANDTICSGQTATLTASIVGTAPGGTTIIWYNALVGGTTLGTGATYTTPALTATTTYYVGTCPGSYHQPVIVVVNPATANAGTGATICSGGSATLNATGGTIYSWSPTTGLSNPNIANPVASPTITTLYTVTVTNSIGCTATASATITVSGAITVSAGSNVSICPGTSTNLLATGGTIYAWSLSTGLSNTTISNPVASPTSTTTYTVTVTNVSGCSAAASVTVTVYPSVTASAGADTTICSSSTAQLHASGGTTYSWSPSGTLSNANIHNPVASPTTTTTYIVTVTNASGCTGSSSVTVTISANLVITVSPPSPSICTGGSTTLTATGGTLYAWSPALGLSATSGTNVIASPSVTTTYSVSATNSSGCTGSTTITVTVGSNLNVTVIPNTPSICPGGNILLTAAGATNYTWSPSTGLSVSTGTSVTADPTITTTYSIDGSDVSGCTGSTTITVTVSPIGATATSTNASCGLSNGTATATPSGTCGMFTFLWNSVPAQTTQTATNLPAGTYTVTVFCGACTATASVVITNTSGPSVTITNTTNADCGQSDGSASISVTGGTSPYSYIWSNGQTTANLSNVSAGSYTLTVTDATGCTSVINVNIGSSSGPSLSITSINASCNLSNGSATVIVTGGIAPFNYLWNTSPSQTTATASGLDAGSYLITVTDAGGCSATDVAIITQSGGVLVSATATPQTCSDTNGTATAYASLGSGLYTYEWNTTPPQTTYMATGLYAGIYIVTVSDGMCTATATAIVGPGVPGPIAGFTAHPKTVPFGDGIVNFTNNSSGGLVSWEWNFGDGTYQLGGNYPQHDYTNLGYYVVSITVTDTNGCTDTYIDTIKVKDIFGFYIPNSFTPNGDDINDVFMPKGNITPTNYDMTIFDRWGNIVFHTSTWGEGWNGTLNNKGNVDKDPVMSVYVYRINYTDADRILHKYLGKVTLVP